MKQQQLTIKALQHYLTLKYVARATSSDLFMKLVEEIGEVAEVLNKMEGRKLADGQMSLEKELVDVIHYAVALAGINNIDLTQAIKDKDAEASLKYKFSPTLNEFLGESEDEKTKGASEKTRGSL